MKRTIIPSLALAVALICLAQSSGTSKQPLTADDVLKSYTQRVYAELLPRASELGYDEVLQSAGKIAAEVLVPHKDLLLEKARAALAELPRLTVDLNKGWEPVAKVEQGAIASGIAALSGLPASQPATQQINWDAVVLAYLWNPQAAASFVRSRALVKHLGAKESGKRVMIETLARPTPQAISADPQHPVLAIQTGPEIFVVSLKRTVQGYYVDEKIQWLKRKGATSQPATAAHQD